VQSQRVDLEFLNATSRLSGCPLKSSHLTKQVTRTTTEAKQVRCGERDNGRRGPRRAKIAPRAARDWMSSSSQATPNVRKELVTALQPTIFVHSNLCESSYHISGRSLSLLLNGIAGKGVPRRRVHPYNAHAYLIKPAFLVSAIAFCFARSLTVRSSDSISLTSSRTLLTALLCLIFAARKHDEVWTKPAA
jgi:hypothetical protein